MPTKCCLWCSLTRSFVGFPSVVRRQ